MSRRGKSNWQHKHTSARRRGHQHSNSGIKGPQHSTAALAHMLSSRLLETMKSRWNRLSDEERKAVAKETCCELSSDAVLSLYESKILATEILSRSAANCWSHSSQGNPMALGKSMPFIWKRPGKGCSKSFARIRIRQRSRIRARQERATARFHKLATYRLEERAASFHECITPAYIQAARADQLESICEGGKLKGGFDEEEQRLGGKLIRLKTAATSGLTAALQALSISLARREASAKLQTRSKSPPELQNATSNSITHVHQPLSDQYSCGKSPPAQTSNSSFLLRADGTFWRAGTMTHTHSKRSVDPLWWTQFIRDAHFTLTHPNRWTQATNVVEASAQSPSKSKFRLSVDTFSYHAMRCVSKEKLESTTANASPEKTAQILLEAIREKQPLDAATKSMVLSHSQMPVTARFILARFLSQDPLSCLIPFQRRNNPTSHTLPETNNGQIWVNSSHESASNIFSDLWFAASVLRDSGSLYRATKLSKSCLTSICYGTSREKVCSSCVAALIDEEQPALLIPLQLENDSRASDTTPLETLPALSPPECREGLSVTRQESIKGTIFGGAAFSEWVKLRLTQELMEIENEVMELNARLSSGQRVKADSSPTKYISQLPLDMSTRRMNDRLTSWFREAIEHRLRPSWRGAILSPALMFEETEVSDNANIVIKLCHTPALTNRHAKEEWKSLLSAFVNVVWESERRKSICETLAPTPQIYVWPDSDCKGPLVHEQMRHSHTFSDPRLCGLHRNRLLCNMMAATARTNRHIRAPGWSRGATQSLVKCKATSSTQRGGFSLQGSMTMTLMPGETLSGGQSVGTKESTRASCRGEVPSVPASRFLQSLPPAELMDIYLILPKDLGLLVRNCFAFFSKSIRLYVIRTTSDMKSVTLEAMERRLLEQWEKVGLHDNIQETVNDPDEVETLPTLRTACRSCESEDEEEENAEEELFYWKQIPPVTKSLADFLPVSSDEMCSQLARPFGQVMETIWRLALCAEGPRGDRVLRKARYGEHLSKRVDSCDQLRAAAAFLWAHYEAILERRFLSCQIGSLSRRKESLTEAFTDCFLNEARKYCHTPAASRAKKS